MLPSKKYAVKFKKLLQLNINLKRRNDKMWISKNTLNVLAIIFFLILVNGCDSLLNKQPKDQLSNQTFWTSESDAELALTGVYSRLTDNLYFGQDRPMLDVLSDNTFTESGSLLPISRGVIEPSTGGAVENIWDGAYRGITTCNNFLNNIDQVEMDEEKKNRYKSEVRFLRAYFYWNLMFFYGGVPIYEQVPTVNNANIPRSSASEVLTLINEDLDFAISNLPDAAYTDGHAIKASARGLKARVAFYEGNFQEVVELTQDIINSGNFQLAENYREMFITAGQGNNAEIIFSTQYSLPNLYSNFDQQISYFAQSQPSQNLIDSYLCTDGEPIGESSACDENSPFENRDPRLDMSVTLPEETWTLSDGTEYRTAGGSTAGSLTGYIQEKYVEKTNAPFSNATRSGQDIIILRYADILLMNSEAKNEISGPEVSIYNALDDIRARVDMPPVERGQSMEEMRETIRQERRIELAMEGLRYYDLKRWRIAHIVMPSLEDPGGADITFEDPTNYLWPIPQSEMDINPELEQNSGY